MVSPAGGVTLIRMTTTTTDAHALTRDEIDRFHREGWLGPYAAVSPDEMAELRSRIDREVLTSDGPNPRNRLQARHMDHRFVYELATCAPIADRIASLIGNDLVLWATYFFNKEPGGAEIPWHQDANYWPIEPPLNLSAWLAIDRVTVENSCVQLIPGSHRAVIPHKKSRDGMAFGEEADPDLIDASRALNVELEPGEFFLFNERLLHHSEPNRSQMRRMGMTMRYTVPFVKLLDQDKPPLFPGHAAILVRGVDRFRLNRMAEPPLM